MNEHDATETAYKNGYKQGKIDAVRELMAGVEAAAFQSGDWSRGVHPMVVELDDLKEIAEELTEEDTNR